MGKRQRWWGLGLVLVVVIPSSALSATLHVSNSGIDAPGCGGSSPCRSIGQAVANAAAGDKIVVGPGLYSNNLDGDGVSGPGEEPAGGIMITKPLQITSELGASSTLVNSSGPVFIIGSSGVTLGDLGKGFTTTSPGRRCTPPVTSGAQPPDRAPTRPIPSATREGSSAVTTPFLTADPTRAQSPVR